MTKIKFCGLTRSADAAHAAEVGAFYGGVIMTRSVRQVTPADAREIFDAAPELKRVGVVGREPISRILRAAEKAELDVLQLHRHLSGDECEQLREKFDGEIWAVLGVDIESSELPESWKSIADSVDALLLDTSIRGKSGGTGQPFDWDAFSPRAMGIGRDIPIVLAGGLNHENVTRAITTLHPAVVDVSSGVESAPGIKSPEMMTAFARAVASASIV
jgi:phosphoribosylanthranilate isomerase